MIGKKRDEIEEKQSDWRKAREREREKVVGGGECSCVCGLDFHQRSALAGEK